ncbi:hypothetical protein DL93DRAFT_1381604 [Clavulina sp. PMI_390]|nr:hypothetical protein DL93DRAFT_1381604 [Clavulina sp. PMI_390]
MLCKSSRPSLHSPGALHALDMMIFLYFSPRLTRPCRAEQSRSSGVAAGHLRNPLRCSLGSGGFFCGLPALFNKNFVELKGLSIGLIQRTGFTQLPQRRHVYSPSHMRSGSSLANPSRVDDQARELRGLYCAAW